MRLFIALSLLATLSGCGVLKVEVAVLDPVVFEEVRAAEAAREYLPVVLGETRTTLASRVDALHAQHRAFYEQLKNEYLAEAARADSPDPTTIAGIADVLLPNFDYTEAPKYEEFQGKLELLRSTIVELTARVDASAIFEEARARASSARAARLLEYSRLVEGIALYVATDTNGQVADIRAKFGLAAAPTAEKIATEALKVKDAARALKPPGAAVSLAGSYFAHAVASAPESKWHQSFNKAVGRGVWGSVDIAIVMNPAESTHFPGDYSVKGMTFNPSDTIAATGKIFTQGLVLLAQASGVPVTGSSDPTTPGGSLAASSSRLQQGKNLLAQKEQQLGAHSDALQSIATAILAEGTNLVSSDATVRGGAITAIEARYSTQKGRLTGATTP